MTNFTSNTYQMKREILNFTNKISKSVTFHAQCHLVSDYRN